VSDSDRTLRLAMLGMVPGNGHPYSWSAIINGCFSAEIIRRTPYPMIADYLGAQPLDQLGIPEARVTHIWCDRRADAEAVAQSSAIPHVADTPQQVIGHVDAVLIATDIGSEHVERARPFVEAGLPVFVDKPLADRVEHLRQFAQWHRAGRRILSTSGLRYAREYTDLAGRVGEIGELRWITMSMAKSWERYGIHAIESIARFAAPGGWEWVVNHGSPDRNIVQLHHGSGLDVSIAVITDLAGAFGHLTLYGSKGVLTARFGDTFYAFKTQLQAFVDYVRHGTSPVAFEETTELIKIVIAGVQSRDAGGRKVYLADIEV
jgi:predicted dehydrogenase